MNGNKKLTRSQISKKVSSLINKVIATNDGFIRDDELDKRVIDIDKKIEKGITQIIGINPIDITEQRIKPKNDYPQDLWNEGVGQKRYDYEYVIPYEDKNGNQKPVTCFYHLTKRFPIDNREKAKPEIWGSGSCVADKQSTNETLEKLKTNGLKLVKNKHKKWTLKSIF